MTDSRTPWLALVVVLALAAVALSGGALLAAEKCQTVNPLGKSLDGWKAKGSPEQNKWAVGTAKVNPDNAGQLVVEPLGDGPPELINATGHGVDIFTEAKFGDCTIELEVMVPKGSNSGIYLMGEYEIQVLDSFGREKVGPGDMGGIYGAAAPKINAATAPGTWQKYVIEFVAPCFDGDKKTANAKCVKITLNGQVIHENVEIGGSTGGALAGKESLEGPLMFQGDHGAVAYRNIKVIVPAEK